ncbi:hypothetical protein BD560DRAFT_384788 [Blakeslea trispora]|nr:hypothetical protein BD560DRAFT_384788 [Blakeslea trispora]
MSDVHGKKREKTTEEVLQARKQKEAVKIKEYNQLVEKIRAKMNNKEYDDEAFSLTTQIVQWNPDHYTIWNYRRTVLLEHVLKQLDQEETQKTYQKELLLFMQLIRINPKSYWLWNHRFWCLQHMPKPDWKAELALVEKMLTLDARNFHGWNYRRYVVSHLRKQAKDETEIADLVKYEYEFTTRKINQSFSNYSAWHQRSKLLPEIVIEMTEKERNEVATNELDLVKNAIYTDPEDQSAWLYYWWLLGRAPDYVECIGAYCLEEDPSVVYIGFNDSVKFLTMPQLANSNSVLSSKMYPICSRDNEAASTWVIVTDKADGYPEKLIIQSSTILPSTSAKSVPQEILWELEINKITQASVLQKRVAELHLKEEWQPTSSKMYNDPTLQDQSAWFSLDKVQLLKDEIETVCELLEIEPESAWALQTLVHFLNQLQLRSQQEDSDKTRAEMIDILDKLIEIDSDRKHRYEDQKTKILFDKATRTSEIETIMTQYNNELDLSSPEKQTCFISKLLFA